jgi:Rrf2 family protein
MTGEEMLIGTKGDYGVRAMIDLARHHTGQPIARNEIASRRQIPEAYLDQLLGLLRRAGFIRSVRGPGGGHLLAREGEEITLLSLLETLEGSLEPISSLNNELDITGQTWIWNEIYDQMRERLESVTLAELAQVEKTNESASAPRYLI